MDVNENRPVDKRSMGCEIFALSYRWGAQVKAVHTRSLTTKSDIEHKSSLGGLTVSLLLQTVRDAITICIKLEQRYLWVDRLCIVQDDENDRSTQISAMDIIFLSAQFVIIAAHSPDMCSGIHGVSLPRPIPIRERVYIDGLVLKRIAEDPCKATVSD